MRVEGRGNYELELKPVKLTTGLSTVPWASSISFCVSARANVPVLLNAAAYSSTPSKMAAIADEADLIALIMIELLLS